MEYILNHQLIANLSASYWNHPVRNLGADSRVQRNDARDGAKRSGPAWRDRLNRFLRCRPGRPRSFSYHAAMGFVLRCRGGRSWPKVSISDVRWNGLRKDGAGPATLAIIPRSSSAPFPQAKPAAAPILLRLVFVIRDTVSPAKRPLSTFPAGPKNRIRFSPHNIRAAPQCSLRFFFANSRYPIMLG